MYISPADLQSRVKKFADPDTSWRKHVHNNKDLTTAGVLVLLKQIADKQGAFLGCMNMYIKKSIYT